MNPYEQAFRLLAAQHKDAKIALLRTMRQPILLSLVKYLVFPGHASGAHWLNEASNMMSELTQVRLKKGHSLSQSNWDKECYTNLSYEDMFLVAEKIPPDMLSLERYKTHSDMHGLLNPLLPVLNTLLQQWTGLCSGKNARPSGRALLQVALKTLNKEKP